MKIPFRLLFAIVCLSVLPGCGSPGGGYNLGPSQTVTGAVGGQTVEGGVPTGDWFLLDRRAYSNFNVSINSYVHIRADGVGNLMVHRIIQWTGGSSCSSGGFAGQPMVAWTTQQPLKSIKRVGNELYVYVDTASQPTLSSATPPGHPLPAYNAIGKSLLSGFHSPLDQIGVGVFKISGQNLVLVSSPDKVPRTFTKQSFSR